MISKDVYETLKSYDDKITRLKHWIWMYEGTVINISYIIRKIKLGVDGDSELEKDLITTYKNLIGWIGTNTSLDPNLIKKYISDYEKQLDNLRWRKEYQLKRIDENKPKPKRRLSYRGQLKSADRKAKRRIKKWKSEPQRENWWVQKYINSNLRLSNEVKPEFDYRYILYFQVPIPSFLEEVGGNKFSVKPEFYI